MCIYSNNRENINDICDILSQNINYFSYMPKGEAGIVSFYDLENTDKNVFLYNKKHKYSLIIYKNKSETV